MQWDCRSSGYQSTVTDLSWSSECNLVLNINKGKKKLIMLDQYAKIKVIDFLKGRSCKKCL